VEASTDATLHYKVLAAVEAGAALAVAVEADPATAQGVGRSRRDALAGGWMLPGGIYRQLDYRKLTHRGLPARPADTHREAFALLVAL
jgi:hypothetical protein